VLAHLRVKGAPFPHTAAAPHSTVDEHEALTGFFAAILLEV
jgi:hypothetical protein